ncbi:MULTISPECIES: helicase HerA domain-containing protein [unclassified Lactobacillus]|uniref:helicase HerA domain-containing protein n=1 Tax=unclassified Lactobacillus TaxID=2620435 RepID=UPI00226A51FA|nr:MULTISPECIES: DUF87 domain-containing protein [unclassified Lactobacillus]MCX8720381.1 DUF87 domain-containing protein [Lactobacillus sp. B4010]MCX8732800.1 DUF87 domain-containing protein [Lactobacillus sp. B4015]MCX8735147.1 DUF87 domain-containing protein [Lactobacillus sp. B4012]
MELKQYLTRCLNMALNLKSGETTYNNSFEVLIQKDGFIFLPRMPASFALDDDLYSQIYKITNAALYPDYTLLLQNAAYFIALKDKPLSLRRGFFFPWIKGIPTRLVINDNLDAYFKGCQDTPHSMLVPIMRDLGVDYRKITSIAIAGNSGSGKTYLLTYLLAALNPISSQTIVIDPKQDYISRYAQDHNIKAIYPSHDESKSDYVSSVNEILSKAKSIIHQRQAAMFDNPTKTFRPITIMIDELLALSEGVNKQIKDSFFELLSQIALLGRASQVHLILCGQRLDHTCVPTSVREQCNVRIQLGNINSATTRFLFPDLDPTGLVIPSGKGTGIIQIIDNDHAYNVQSLLCPTYGKEK